MVSMQKELLASARQTVRLVYEGLPWLDIIESNACQAIGLNEQVVSNNDHDCWAVGAKHVMHRLS